MFSDLDLPVLHEDLHEKQFIKLYTECLCTLPYRNYISILKEAKRYLRQENLPTKALPRRLGMESFQHLLC